MGGTMRELAGRISGSRPFEYFIIALILGGGAILGLETIEPLRAGSSTGSRSGTR